MDVEGFDKERNIFSINMRLAAYRKKNIIRRSKNPELFISSIVSLVSCGRR